MKCFKVCKLRKIVSSFILLLLYPPTLWLGVILTKLSFYNRCFFIHSGKFATIKGKLYRIFLNQFTYFEIGKSLFALNNYNLMLKIPKIVKTGVNYWYVSATYVCLPNYSNIWLNLCVWEHWQMLIFWKYCMHLNDIAKYRPIYLCSNDSNLPLRII